MKYLPHVILKAFNRHWRRLKFRLPVDCHGVSQKLCFPRSGNHTFCLVDFQLEPGFKERGYRNEYSFGGLLALDIDIAVICISAKAMPSALQFFIECIQHNI